MQYLEIKTVSKHIWYIPVVKSYMHFLSKAEVATVTTALYLNLVIFKLKNAKVTGWLGLIISVHQCICVHMHTTHAF